MSYELRKSDGNVLGTVGDGIADTSLSSLTFIGKNLSNFGKFQNENFLHLVENFAYNQEPLNKLVGQTWYDTNSYSLKLYTGGSDWVSLAVVDATGTTPTTGRPGYLWFNTTTKQLSVSDGTSYTMIGPERVQGYGVTRLSSTEVLDTNLINHAVIKAIVDGETVGILSTASFFVHSSNAIAGFTTVKRGFNLKYQTNDFPLLGVAHNSNYSSTATHLSGGVRGSIPFQTETSSTVYLGIGNTNTFMYSNGSVPSWVTTSSMSVGYATSATNLSGGAQGSLPYQNAAGKTQYIPLDTAGFVLTAGATRPVWLPLSGLSAGTALTATNASYLLREGNTSVYAAASTGTTGSTIVERDVHGGVWGSNIYATNAYATNAYLTTATAVLFDGVASSAQYADLAEKYLPDAEYEPGTVVVIGGEKEITKSDMGQRAIGVISTNPAYMMNKDLEGGVYVALKGRVPCKVYGNILKGQRLIAGENGAATSPFNGPSPDVFAVALESHEGNDVDVIEVVVL